MVKYNRLETAIFNVFTERGITSSNWRIKVTNKEIIGQSDFAKVKVEVYEPRKRKPCMFWDLYINIVKEQIHWDKSTFNYL